MKWQAAASGAINENLVINGSLDFWQRGTSLGGTGGYGADRWRCYRTGGGGGTTYSRQTASLEGFTYSMRIQRDSGQTGTAANNVTTSFESLQVRNWQGQKLTLSFWAKKGANFSSASDLITAKIITGTGTNSNVADGFTSQADAASNTFTLTSSWQKFTLTTSSVLGSTISQLGLLFSNTPVGTASTNDWFEIAGIKLEFGDTATTWVRNSQTLEGELATCQRYYFRFTAEGAYSGFTLGTAGSTTQLSGFFRSPSSLRVKPTSVEFSTLAALDDAGLVQAITALTLYAESAEGTIIRTTTSGLTQGRSYFIGANNSTSAYIALNAEL